LVRRVSDLIARVDPGRPDIQVSNKTSNWLKTGPLHLHQADLDNAIANLQKADP